MDKRTGYVVSIIAALGLLAAPACFAADGSGVVKIDLPPETARLKPGPGEDVTGKYCSICHSVDYIYMQPPLTLEQWKGLVAKMKKAFGAPIADEDIDAIASYLASQNGRTE